MSSPWLAGARPRSKSTPSILVVAAALVPLMGARSAAASPPPPDLMGRMAAYAAGFEAMRNRASFALDGRMETLDRSGQPDGLKVMQARVEGDGRESRFVVVKYTEDGDDKTADAQDKARERADERKAHPEKKRIRIPTLAAEQARYVFDEVEVDPTDPSRVRIAFVPREPAEDTIEGSAWIDARTGAPISAGFKISKTPAFVDYVHVTLEFGARTELGAAVSRVVFDGGGAFLFFHKRFHGSATLSGYRIVP
ncbi:MAG TPA: hypothetical protein VHV30_13870 [Polyangiaceae bacterium]|jgi:hypothetical protein|nr:hypothetical protein [Polyangiaceae bacterium]